MYTTGFAIPIFGVFVLSLLYAMLGSVSALVLLYFGIETSRAAAAGIVAVTLVAIWALIWRPGHILVRRNVGCRLHSVRSGDQAVLGEKIARQATAARAGLTVPAGFVISGKSLTGFSRPLAKIWVRFALTFLMPRDGSLIVRSSVPGEDDPDAGLAGRYGSKLVDNPTTVSILSAADELSTDIGEPGFGILVQVHHGDGHGLVASIEPVSHRQDLVRIERYTNRESAASGRVIARHILLEKSNNGTAPAWFDQLQRAEFTFSSDVLLEVAGSGLDHVVQVRPLAEPDSTTFAISSYVAGGYTLLPDNLTTAQLRKMFQDCGSVLPEPWVHNRLLYLCVADQARLVRQNRPWQLRRQLRQAAASARMQGTAPAAIAEMLAIRMQFSVDLQLLAQLGQAKAMNKLRVLWSGNPTEARQEYAEQVVQWYPGLLPWRGWLATRIVNEGHLAWQRYEELRPESTSSVLPDDVPAAIIVSGGDVKLFNEQHLDKTAIVHGSARGPLAIVEQNSDLDNVSPGAVVWAPEAYPWIGDKVRQVAAIIVQHGGALSHLALNARAANIPFVSGISRPDSSPGTPVTVDVDDANVNVVFSETGNGTD